MITKFGTAKINHYGYYQITSVNEGNNGKYLHRLVWEDWYQKPVPEGYDIHHINENKIDNRIQNLQCVEHKLHVRSHQKGKKLSPEHRKKLSEANKGKSRSDETKRKIAEALKGENHPFYGKNHSEESKLKMSEAHNTSGYFRVSKHKDCNCKQGFLWNYNHYVDGKRKTISSVDIKKLEMKVREKGLKWYKIGDKDVESH